MKEEYCGLESVSGLKGVKSCCVEWMCVLNGYDQEERC